MKKCFFGAIAVLALASCSNEKVVELSQDQEIKFTVEAGKATSRAKDGYCNNKKPADFQVWANVPVSDEGTAFKPYFSNELFALQAGNIWANKADGESRYWPYGKINFFAVKNATADWTKTGTNYDYKSLVVSDFTVADNAEDQVDFIYAVANVASKPTEGVTSINFRHALSQIEFQAKNENTKLYVEISGVSVCKINNKGTFVLPTTSTDALAGEHQEGGNYADNFTGKKQGEWTLATPSSKTTYSVTTKNDADNANDVKEVAGDGVVVDLTVTDPSDKEYNSQTLYLLPQTTTAWVPSPSAPKPAEQDDSYFLVKCKIFNVAGSSYNEETDVRIWPATNTYADVAIPFAANWEQGKRYVYTFVFTDHGNGGFDPDNGKDVLVPIKLTVTVDDFVEGGNTPVDMVK